MQTLLGGWGCRVLKAADLAEALAAIEGSGREPDGLLVDYHLDGGNGVAAIAELRRRCRPRPAGDPGHRRPLACTSAKKPAPPASHVLNKPLKPASLRALISAVAGAARRGGVTGATLLAPAPAAIGRLRSCRRR